MSEANWRERRASARRVSHLAASATQELRQAGAGDVDGDRFDTALAAARVSSGTWLGAVQRYSVRRSGPPSMHAYTPGCVPFTSSSTSPPSAMRRHAPVYGHAAQIAPSASRHMPSTVAPWSFAHTRRFDSAPSARDGERADAPAHALADEQRAAIGRDRSAVRERDRVRDGVRATIGFDRDQHGFARLLTGVDVETEVADVRASDAVDDHVVALRRRDRRQVGVQDERAVGLEAQHTPIAHRHDEHAPVGQPSEARWLLGHLARSSRPCRRCPSRRPLPCWSENHRRSSCQRGPSGKREAVEDDRRRAARSWVGTVALEPARADVVEIARGRLGQARHDEHAATSRRRSR